MKDIIVLAGIAQRNLIDVQNILTQKTYILCEDLVELLSKSGVEVTEHLQVVTDYLSELKLSLVESREDLGLELSLGLAEVVAHVEGLEREIALEEVALGLCQASADFEGS